MPDNVLMEEMAWPAIKQAMEAGKDTAIVVAGAIEQHGPHLPTGTDTIIGYALAEAVARNLGNALVAPVIRPALSFHHIGFPGTLTLGMTTFVKMLEEFCLSLKAHGFKNLVLFTSHGGNTDALKAFTPDIAQKLAPGTRLLFVHTVRKNLQAIQQQLAGKGIPPAKDGVHSGFSETSIMLMLRPDLVNMDRAAPGLTDEAFYRPENIAKSQITSFIHGIKSQSKNGILGDPTGAGAAVGREIFDARVADLTAEITANLDSGRTPPDGRPARFSPRISEATPVADKVFLEEMSWVEIEAAVKKGKTTVIVVSGAVEQHGPHLPTGTDTFLGYEIAGRAAGRLGNALVAAVVRPCLSKHHMQFPGSLTLGWETYFQVLSDYCESLSNCGFTDIVLASSHGGNTAVMRAVAPEIARKFKREASVHLVDYLTTGMAAELAFLEKLGIPRARAGVHAGYGETCAMLVAQPHLVKMEYADKGLTEDAFYDPQNVARSQIDAFIHGVKFFSENGVLGDPRGATADIGEKLLNMASAIFAEAIALSVDSGS